MGTRQVGLRDVEERSGVSRLRLLAPLRYLAIAHPEKHRYDFVVPVVVAIAGWAVFMLISPKPRIFGDPGLLKFTRDLLIMAVPFMVGALAAVSMGAPGKHLDRRPAGNELLLDGAALSLRQFLCYLLGYLSFLGLATLVAVVAAELFKDVVLSWTEHVPNVRFFVKAVGSLVFSCLLSALAVTVLWSLYFLTDIANREA